MNPLAGQIVLGIYAILLAAGGLIGFLKAGSRPSLIAGLLSAIGAGLAAFFVDANSRLDYMLGAGLAAILLGFFGSRFAKARKFMPGGLMTLISFAVLVFLVYLMQTTRPTAPTL